MVNPGNAPQGMLRYAGIWCDGEFQVTRTGTTMPDQIRAQFVLSANLPQYGNLEVFYGDKWITIPDCRVSRMEITSGVNGRYREVEFEDRRWRWKYAYAFGHTNFDSGHYYLYRMNDLSVLDTIRYLLDIVGEGEPEVYPVGAVLQVEEDRYGNYKGFTQYSVAQHFDGRTVAECLEEMLQYLGLRLYLGWDNVVRLYAMGYGRSIPSDQRVMDYSVSVTPPVVPETIVFEFKREVFENDFFLEPVGYLWDVAKENPSSAIVPLDLLNYGPINQNTNRIDWSLADPPNFTRIQDKRQRELCRRTIFKMYRIDSLQRKSLLNPFFNPTVAGLNIEFNANDFILDDALWVDRPLSQQAARPQPPVQWSVCGVSRDYQRLHFDEDCKEFTVVGYFALRTLGQVANNAQIAANYQLLGTEFEPFDTPTLRTQYPDTVYNGGVTFDPDTRVVKTETPLYFVNRNPAGAVQQNTYLPAKIMLRAQHKLRRRFDMELMRMMIPVPINSNYSVPGLVEKVVIDGTHYWSRANAGVDLSPVYYQQLAQQYVASKSVSESATIPMKGFAFDVSPDGNIPSVVFSRNASGQCTTTVQWQKENPLMLPAYDEEAAKIAQRAFLKSLPGNAVRNARNLKQFMAAKGF
jgi:hypothetical protein